jgi:RNA polymerase-binding transcription factor DksA
MATMPRFATSMFPEPLALTTDQRAHILRRLLEERHTITRRLARYGHNADEVSSSNRVPLHMADVGSETMQESLDAVLASRDSRTLADIDDALRRFYRDPSSFGVDQRTGAPIGFERLDIIPWTRDAR